MLALTIRPLLQSVCTSLSSGIDRPAAIHWLKEQWRRQSGDFPQQFARNIPIPGQEPAAYAHRRIQLAGTTLLAGIRFLGGDPKQPFVDLLAWRGRTPVSRLNWPQIQRSLGAAFAGFRPTRIRVLWPANQPSPAAFLPDLVVVSGDLQTLRPPAASGRAQRTSAALVRRHFRAYRDAMQAVHRARPALAPHLQPCEQDDLVACAEARAAVLWQDDRGGFAGLAAALPQRWRGLVGYEMQEELLVGALRGQGLGPRLQGDLIRQLQEARAVGSLFGTIHHENGASLATARRCGRLPVGTFRWVPLPG